MVKENELHLKLITAEKPKRPALQAEECASKAHPSDDGLMLLVAADDSRAFARLVANNELSVRRFCFGMLGNQAQADEAAQETFLKLWQERTRYLPLSKFRAFLFSIARNRCISLLRRRALISFIGLDTLKGEPVSPATSERGDLLGADVNERDAILRAAIARLPAKLRVAVILRFVEEMGYDEIAKVIGRSVSAARSRVHYGLKALARSLPEEVCTWND